MRNVLRVFARDLKRLLHAPAALIVVLFLSLLPSLYAWFNVAAFWDPYENTGNMRVYVVNEDAGTDSDLVGHLDVGARVVEELGGNEQLDWTFADREDALAQVRAGRAYGAFVIPADFSASILSFTTGDFQQTQLEYYLNEKSGPLVPKIMDTAAQTLETTINDQFVAAVSEAVAQGVNAEVGTVEGELSEGARSAAAKLSAVSGKVGDARDELTTLAGDAGEAAAAVGEARGDLEAARAGIDRVAGDLDGAATVVNRAADELPQAAAGVDAAADAAASDVGAAGAAAAEAAGALAAGVQRAQGAADAASERADAAVAAARGAAADLRDLAAVAPGDAARAALEQQAASLEARADSLATLLASLDALSRDLGDGADAAASAAASVDAALADSLAALDAARAAARTTSVPAAAAAIAQVSASIGTLSGIVAAQQTLIDQGELLLDGLADTLVLLQDALGQTDGLLAGFQGDLDSAAVDVAALSSSSALSDLLGQDGLDPATLADFMASPTLITAEVLYPLDHYGSAMAPLFINLTLWVGAFMLMVIFRLEVDGKGLPGVSARQAYLGRLLLLSCVAAVQAVVCCAGCLVIGMQYASLLLFFLTAVCASLAYLSLQYLLSSALQHVGKALCIILVFVQIPGASGLYPIEMTPAFFQFVYPLFPFTYGIDAMREAIAGFYGSAWGSCIGVLAGYLLVCVAAGALVKPLTGNLNRLFAKQIAESDLIVGEEVALPERRYRLSYLFRALADRDEYRAALAQRAEKFMRVYPSLKVWALFVGIIVPAAGAVFLSLAEADKVVLLTMWLIVFVAIVMFLVIVEYVRDNLQRQLSLEQMSDDDVRGIYLARAGRRGPAPDGEGKRS